MFSVMVEFDVTADQTPKLLNAIGGLLDEIVCVQPGFVSARLQQQADGPAVINNMVWKSAEDFAAFRAKHADYITSVVGPYGPKFRFFDVKKSVAPLSAAVG